MTSLVISSDIVFFSSMKLRHFEWLVPRVANVRHLEILTPLLRARAHNATTHSNIQFAGKSLA